MSRTSKTPQEKKKLSLQKDRRNAYGENDKGSRKTIPNAKAREHRRSRHKQNQAIAAVNPTDDLAVDVVGSSARRDVYRKGGWTKHADIALSEHIQRKLRGRTKRFGRRRNKESAA